MKLFIDTSDSKKTVVGLDGKVFEYKTAFFKSQKLLESINKSLKLEKKSLKDISAIEVNLGPGSFTGLRVGVSVANALSWALQIPINNKKAGTILTPFYREKRK